MMSGWGTGEAQSGLGDPASGWRASAGANEQNSNSFDEAGKHAAAPRPVENPQSKGWVTKEAVDYAALVEKSAAAETAWGHNRPKYEYIPTLDGKELGDIGPAVPELEDQLFKDKWKNEAGQNVKAYHQYSVEAEGPEAIKPVRDFESAGLHPVVLENIRKMKYSATTPVQSFVIPAVKLGYDVVGVAQTGSGKTAAYMIPIFSILMGKAKKLAKQRPNPLTYDPSTDGICAEPLVLIVCPTRELALQIFDEARRLSYRSMLRPCLAYGGGPKRGQLDDIKRGCDILIGTPGRLKDFIVTESRWLSLRRLKYTVLDEADEMLNDDWQEEMSCMLGGGASQASAQHQYMMFSATFPKFAREVARKYLQDEHLFLKVGRIGSIHTNVFQDVIWVDEDKKQQALMDLILSEAPCRTLIFVNALRKAEIVDDILYNNEFPVTSIHSNKTQLEREKAIRDFIEGKAPIMVSTGVSARGLDIKNVMHIINYDIPSGQHGGITEYIHRVGRTARIGHMGRATSFYNERDEDMAVPIVKALMETDQKVPDFLEGFKPEKLGWEEDQSDGEADQPAGVDVASGGWGNAARGATGEGWGSGAAGVSLNIGKGSSTGWGNASNEGPAAWSAENAEQQSAGW